MTKTFKNTGEDFSGYDAAERWLKANGYSVGILEAGSPTGIALGAGRYISKWRNLGEDVEKLDGQIEANNDVRHNDIIVTLW